MKRQIEPFVDNQDWNRDNSQPSWCDDHYRPQSDPNFNHNNNNTEPPNSADGGFRSKRVFRHSGRRAPQDHLVDGCNLPKLYVAPIPRTITEHDIHELFAEYGNVVQVVFATDKRNVSLRGGYCFVKYTTHKEADMAIAALNDQYFFQGGQTPIRVKYAEGGRERLGHVNSNGGRERPVTGIFLGKLFVGGLNKLANEHEVVEIFSAYGHVEDIYLVRDEHKLNRGYGFVKFSQKEMALAAINALDGQFVMQGCDQPLAVRFADPKKPKTGDSRPFSNFGDSVGRQQNQQIGSNLSQVEPPHWTNPEVWPHDVNPPSHPSTQTLEHSQKFSSTRDEPTWSGSNCNMVSQYCDWSEHTCPDGFKYYYNCETCESLWEKPSELALFEQNLQNKSKLQNTDPQHCQAVPIQEEVDHMQIRSETSRL